MNVLRRPQTIRCQRGFQCAGTAVRWPKRLTWRYLLVAMGVTFGVGCRVDIPEAQRVQVSEEALRFARLLMARDYAAAHAMTSAAYRARVSVDSLGRAFEFSVPRTMHPVDSLHVLMTDAMGGWKVRTPSDIGWVYVVIPGDSTRDSEAVSVILAQEREGVRIREVEIGRP